MPDSLLAVDTSAVWSALWPALLIAILRVGDVTLNVFRTVFTVSGKRPQAALASGAESLLWVSAAGIVFSQMTPIRTAGFVVGVATGTWVGMAIVHRLRLGMVTVRIYSSGPDPALSPGVVGGPSGQRIMHRLHEAGFGATVFEGRGYRGPVEMVLSTVRRRDVDRVIEVARRTDADAFIAVDNDKYEATLGHARV